ncbi:MAG: DNA cytosine methyltransferase, partial [Thermoproteus sp.]|nr:DNA cytosine methyltransferase [Thermoproteus sp.]
GDFWTAKALAERALRGSVFRTYPVASMEVLEGGRIDDLQDVYFSIMKEWEGVWSDVGTQQALEWKQKVWDKLTFDVVEDYLAANGADAVGIEEALKQHEDVLRFLGYDRPAHELKLSDGTTELPRVSQAVSDKLRRIPPGENYKFLEGTPWAMKGHDISLIYRRLHPLRPSYTVVAYGGGGTYGYHYRRSRTQLSLRELARLQSFPDDFLFCGSKHEIRAQIGEAVPPLASFVLAKIVHDILHLT